MANLLYKNHRIIAGADLDKTTGRWIPIASISLTTEKGQQRPHFLTDIPKRYRTAREAVDHGIVAGKAWVRQRAKHSLDEVKTPMLPFVNELRLDFHNGVNSYDPPSKGRA